MAIALAGSAEGTATGSGLTLIPASPLSIIGQNPGPGQLMVVGARTAGNSPAPTAVCYSASYSSTSPDFTYIGQENNTGTTYISLFWKVATGSESSVQVSYNNSGQGTGQNASVIGFLGFNGFVGSPTLDSFAVANVSGSTAVETGALPVAVNPELWVGFAALSNTYSGSPTFKVSGVLSGTIVTAAGTTQMLAGYYLNSTTPAGGTTISNFTWGTSRNTGMVVATFYDPASIVMPSPPIRPPTAVMRASNWLIDKQPWKRSRDGLILPGFADKQLVLA
jgi:hypothetical protein